MTRILPHAVFRKLKALAPMGFLKAMPPVLRFWSMRPVGLNIIIRAFLPVRC